MEVDILELIEKLLNINSVSGFEKSANSELKNIVGDILGNVNEDACGNLTGIIPCGKNNAPTVMLTAHYDIIGLISKGIHENGFVSFAPTGGIDSRLLPGAEVVIHGKTKDFYGIIGLRPPHILTAEEMKKTESIEKLLIDTGVNNDELEKEVPFGSPISFRNTVRYFGGCVSASGLDNKLGCYAVLSAAKRLKNMPLNSNICVALTVSEETGRSGGKTAAYNINPDMALVIDATFAKTPECEGRTENEIGGGPVICKGPSLNRFYTDKLIKTAGSLNLPFQIEVEGGDNGTDAFVIETVKSGVPCALVSFPLKYMHSPVETASFEDTEKLITLITEFSANFERRDFLHYVKKTD